MSSVSAHMASSLTQQIPFQSSHDLTFASWAGVNYQFLYQKPSVWFAWNLEIYAGASWNTILPNTAQMFVRWNTNENGWSIHKFLPSLVGNKIIGEHGRELSVSAEWWAPATVILSFAFLLPNALTAIFIQIQWKLILYIFRKKFWVGFVWKYNKGGAIFSISSEAKTDLFGGHHSGLAGW